MTRQAFQVTLRSTLNGTEWRATIWQRDADAACASVARKVKRSGDAGSTQTRVIECRPATRLEIAGHFMRMAARGAISSEEAADRIARECGAQ